MANDATEIRIGADFTIYVAPVGTAEPANIDTALNAAFNNLGYTDENGIKFSVGKTTVAIPVGQSFYPGRQIVTAEDATASFVLRQWNRDTIEMAYGVGTWTDQGAGKTKFTPPAPSVLNEVCAILQYSDGTKDTRIVIPRCQSVETVETEFNRLKAADLPVTLSVLAPNTGSFPWYRLTDDPDVAS